MSSPISKQRKNIFAKFLKNIHQRHSHSNRVSLLAKEISTLINQNVKEDKLRCLDVGCGDMTLAEKLHELLYHSQWECLDVYPLPEQLKNEPRWEKYSSFNGRDLPVMDDSFDVVLLADVLHHAKEDQAHLLHESARVGKYIVIKDHFEYGWFSRRMLQLMDIVGNWGYGVPIPDRYFTKKSYDELIVASGLDIKEMKFEINLYEHLPIINYVIKPKWQFISILIKK